MTNNEIQIAIIWWTYGALFGVGFTFFLMWLIERKGKTP